MTLLQDEFDLQQNSFEVQNLRLVPIRKRKKKKNNDNKSTKPAFTVRLFTIHPLEFQLEPETRLPNIENPVVFVKNDSRAQKGEKSLEIRDCKGLSRASAASPLRQHDPQTEERHTAGEKAASRRFSARKRLSRDSRLFFP